MENGTEDDGTEAEDSTVGRDISSGTGARTDACRCKVQCEPAGSDTAHGSHGFSCDRNYQKWDTERRLKW